MNILLLSFGDVEVESSTSAGAGRAATNIFLSLLSTGSNVEFWVVQNNRPHPSITSKNVSFLGKHLGGYIPKIDFKISKFINPDCQEWQTAGMFGSYSSKKINKSSFAIVNLQWLGHGVISLRSLNRIKKPIVWTLHDEYILHNLSHYPQNISHRLPTQRNRINSFLARLLSGYISKQKEKFILKSNVYFACPSKSLMQKVLQKYPKKEASTFYIENPVDLSIFCLDKEIKAKLLTANKKPIILFVGGSRDQRKGWHLATLALQKCRSTFDIIVVGSDVRAKTGVENQINIIGISKVRPEILSFLYSISVLTLVTSLAESGGPQVASESISCGTPVLGFDTGKLKQIIRSFEFGSVIDNFDTDLLTREIDNRVDCHLTSHISKKLARFAEINWSYEYISNQYLLVFNKAYIDK
jgi:glycosyltransferase involved in cell wall biosynthesis